MHWIVSFIISHSTLCSIVLTTMLSLWMISSPPQQQLNTARALSVTIFYPFQLTVSQTKRIENVFAENRRLKKEVVELSTEMAHLKEYSFENKRLKALLEISDAYSFTLIPVRVIARDPSQLYRTVVVDAGAKDSVLRWMPLLGEKGVVGKVLQVMNQVSLVQLLRDPSNRTSVMVRKTRSVNILETENGVNFFFRARSHDEVQKGDTIVTSGLGGIYPKGLMIGVVSKIEDVNNPLFKKVFVKLSIDFENLEEVFIMRLSPQWASFRQELDSLEVIK